MGLFLFISNMGQGMGTWEKWFTEGMAFARNTRLIFPPPPSPFSPLIRATHRAPTFASGGYEEQDEEEHEEDEALGRVAHMGRRIATEADGLILAISRRSFRLARLGLCLERSPLHHINPTRSHPLPDGNRLLGLAWRDSAIFVVLVDSSHFTRTF